MASIPYGHCHCGCGQKTKIAQQSSTRYGHIKGEPHRYLHLHHCGGEVGPPEQRFWRKTEKAAADECWPWRGALDKGYGSLSVAGRSVPAHRFAYELLVGPIPEGLVIDHLCRNRACVNPEHLEPVTIAENVYRGEAPDRVLTRELADEIRAIMDSLCEHYGVRPQTLADIGQRTTWKPTP